MWWWLLIFPWLMFVVGIMANLATKERWHLFDVLVWFSLAGVLALIL